MKMNTKVRRQTCEPLTERDSLVADVSIQELTMENL